MGWMRVVAVLLALLAVAEAVYVFGADSSDRTTVAYLFIVLPAVGAVSLWLRADEAKPSRPCPRCGRPVEVGVLDCPHCEFDFRTIGA